MYTWFCALCVEELEILSQQKRTKKIREINSLVNLFNLVKTLISRNFWQKHGEEREKYRNFHIFRKNSVKSSHVVLNQQQCWVLFSRIFL